MKMAVFCVVVPWVIITTLMMEVVQTSETLADSYQSTQHYNPEDSHLHSHRRDNLKSYSEDYLQ
jgi:hypothetical protein